VTTTIWLLRYPVELGMSTVEHVEDWVREFKLMALGREDGTSTSDVPARLQAMVDMLTRRYGAERSEPDRVRAAAAARGQATVDPAYTSRDRAESEAVVRGWQTMLAEVDEYCRAEDLLTLQRTPEQVRLQDWVFEQFLRQLAGEPPEPWTPRPTVAPVPPTHC
jgi:hypothetical protein